MDEFRGTKRIRFTMR